MRSEAQTKEILKRIKLELKIFEESNYTLTDEEIVVKMSELGIKTSSSTVGRDLNSKLLESIIGKNALEELKEKRRKNQINGRSKGGVSSTSNNEPIRDEIGKFIGNKHI